MSRVEFGMRQKAMGRETLLLLIMMTRKICNLGKHYLSQYLIKRTQMSFDNIVLFVCDGREQKNECISLVKRKWNLCIS